MHASVSSGLSTHVHGRGATASTRWASVLLSAVRGAPDTTAITIELYCTTEAPPRAGASRERARGGGIASHTQYFTARKTGKYSQTEHLAHSSHARVRVPRQ